ncbi:MAG: hypothetical protein JNN07_01965 [Verrucomicrobiales bacterium]|nr:hypothetical protein [Verrucomicrobiales bacterium]
MRKKLLSLLIVPFAFAVTGYANDIEPTKEFYTVVPTPRAIVLDGSLSEWGGVPVLADPKFSIPKGSAGGNYVLFEEYNGGTWSGPDDQTSAVQIVYDTDNVYFGFVVTDDYHENAAKSAWNGDSIQLMIANAERSSQVALYNYALGGVEDATAEVIVMHEAGPGGTEAVVTRDSATKRTTYEIKLPKSALGLETLGGGTQFGLGMAINDGDELTPGQKGWGGLGAHALVFGKSPSETALITLAAGNDIEPGKQSYTANATASPIVVDGTLDEWGGVPVLADPKFSIPKGSGPNGTGTYVLFEEYNGGTWSGPDDQTSAVQIVYDADNVYFGFVVTDEYHENAANSAWNGDSIQLMIASADRTRQVALYNYALGGVEGNVNNVIIMHEAGPGGTEAIVTRDGVNKKTIYEIKLPVASLGLEAPLTVGTQFGLGMAINDGDELTPGQKGWGGLGAHSIVFGKSPSETALITLGDVGAGADRLFLSAVNPSINLFSFRANDKGISVLDPATVKLTIDGKAVTLVASPKVLDATDFSYTPSALLSFGEHTYAIEVKDTRGNVITDSGTFTIPTYPVLTASMKAGSYDATKRGFVWKVFYNQDNTPNTIDDAELALTGQSGFENTADPAAIGAAVGEGVYEDAVVRFDIEGVINLSQLGGDSNASFPDDLQMPGLPAPDSGIDPNGIQAEIVTFVELPAGLITLGFNSDDRFRTQGGAINDPANALFLGERDQFSATLFRFIVEVPGVYPIRTVYQETTGAAYLEWFSVKPDGSKVLLNDDANGGYKTYRVGTLDAGGSFSLAIARSGAGAISVSWTEAGTVLQQSTDLANWSDVVGAASPYAAPGAGAAVYYRLRK